MKLVIHAGMNKTGTSSIQRSFAQISRPDFHYIDWKSVNHSEMFVLLFQPPEIARKYHIFVTQGWSDAALAAEKSLWQDKLLQALATNQAAVTLFSGEDITQPTANTLGVQNMAAFFKPYFDEIRVIAYARDPISFASSSFQQRVKSAGQSEIDINALWPHYRRRFERLDQVFGRDNVEIVPFLRDQMRGGDLVTDFSARAGIEMPQVDPVRANDSLSLEALSLLFAQRRLAGGIKRGFREATRANNAFIFQLSSIGKTKFAFSPDLTGGLIARHRDDMNWIEARTGVSLELPPAGGGVTISSAQDFMEIARTQVEALAALEARLRDKGRPEIAAQMAGLREFLQLPSQDCARTAAN